MNISRNTITKGFIIAGLANSSVLIFSRLFTNPTIPAFDPVVMSNFGLLMICIWGLAYISVAKNFESAKWLIGVFALEKFIYGWIWINWMSENSVLEVLEADSMAGMFYAIYGVNDWVFFFFFTYVFARLVRAKK